MRLFFSLIYICKKAFVWNTEKKEDTVEPWYNAVVGVHILPSCHWWDCII